MAIFDSLSMFFSFTFVLWVVNPENNVKCQICAHAVLKSHDFSSSNWINGDSSQFEIPLNDFRVFLSSSLANKPAFRLGEEGVGKQRMNEGVTAVLWLGGLL